MYIYLRGKYDFIQSPNFSIAIILIFHNHMPNMNPIKLQTIGMLIYTSINRVFDENYWYET